MDVASPPSSSTDLIRTTSSGSTDNHDFSINTTDAPPSGLELIDIAGEEVIELYPNDREHPTVLDHNLVPIILFGVSVSLFVCYVISGIRPEGQRYLKTEDIRALHAFFGKAAFLVAGAGASVLWRQFWSDQPSE